MNRPPPVRSRQLGGIPAVAEGFDERNAGDEAGFEHGERSSAVQSAAARAVMKLLWGAVAPLCRFSVKPKHNALGKCTVKRYRLHSRSNESVIKGWPGFSKPVIREGSTPSTPIGCGSS